MKGDYFVSLLVLVISFENSLSKEDTEHLTVEVFEEFPNTIRQKRHTGLSDELHFRFSMPESTSPVHLRLKRSALIPVATSSPVDDQVEDENSGVYIDNDIGSSVIVRNDEGTLQLNGVFPHDGSAFEIKHKPNTDVTTGSTNKTINNLSEDRDGPRGFRHFVRRITKVDLGEDGVKFTGNYEELVDKLGINKASDFVRRKAKENMKRWRRIINRRRFITKPDKLPQAIAKSQIMHVVEICMLADYTDYSFFVSMYGSSDAVSEMRLWYTYIANLIDIRYDSIDDSRFKVNTVVNKLVIFTNNADDDFLSNFASGNKIDPDSGISAIRSYVASEPSILPTSDHYMWFTQLDLCKGSSCDVLGVAYVGAVCSSGGVSFNEDTRQGNLGLIAAHELGHSLSSYHDGDATTGTCSNNDQFVMAAFVGHASEANKGNPFKFSSCSIEYFYNYLSSTTCTLPENTGNVDDLPFRPEGEVYPESEQCELRFGTGSVYNLAAQNGFGGESIKCRLLYCLVPGTESRYSAIHAQEYTPCGVGNWCISGYCVPITPTTASTTTPTTTSTTTASTTRTTTPTTPTTTTSTTTQTLFPRYLRDLLEKNLALLQRLISLQNKDGRRLKQILNKIKKIENRLNI